MNGGLPFLMDNRRLSVKIVRNNLLDIVKTVIALEDTYEFSRLSTR